MVPSDDTNLPVAFDDVTIDFRTYEIVRGGADVPAEPQVLDVLAYLIEHRDRVVPKEELLDNVWGDRFVSESALTSRIKSARKCVGDDGRSQRVIRTIHGRGYQFVAEIAPTPGSNFGPATTPIRAGGDRTGRRGTEGRQPRVSPPANALVGRDALLETLSERLQPGRLLTMVGPAGVGKTHMAKHVAASLGDRFVDGSWFVELANVRDPAAVGMALLDALGQPQFPESTPEETVVAVLRDSSGLVVIDNCEHLLDRTAEVLTDLLAAAPILTVVATSRQRLGIAGELVMDIPVLDDTASAELFAARADEHGVTLESTLPAVREICALLDHLPLAIELACAQTRIFDLEQLTELLDQRMQLLQGATNHHHQTLEYAIATSYEELDPDLQETLCRFSVFAGSFGLAEATGVARGGDRIGQIEAVQHLIELAERSLLVVQSESGSTRYRLLESVRLFGAERLADSADVKAIHLAVYCENAERRFDVLNGPGLQDGFGEVLTDWDNYRAAVNYALELDRIHDAARLLAAVEDVAAAMQRYEHADWAERVISAAPEGDRLTESVRAGLARFMVFKDFDRVPALLDSLSNPEEFFGALDAAAYHSFLGLDHEAGDQKLQAMLDMAGASNGLRELYALGTAVFLRSTSEGRDFQGPLKRLRRIGDQHGTLGQAFMALGNARDAFAKDDPAETIRQCGQTLELAEKHGLGILIIGAARARSMGLASHPDLDMVAEQLVDSLRRYQSRGHWTAATLETPLVARVLLEGGRTAPAAQLLGAYSASGYGVSWSAMVAQPLISKLETEHPELMDVFEDGQVLSGAALCQVCLDELDQYLSAKSS